MTTETSARDPVEALADSFLDRLRRGEHPAVSEYVEKYPDLAEQIHDLFPTLAMVERLGPEPARAADEAGGRIGVDDVPLRQLGEYRVIREVGRGGMGVVYEAEQESLGRRVALKVLPARAARDAMHLKRFHREARAAARLHHTNIVPVFDVGEQAGVYYYAMQFIQGQGLDEVFVELRRLRGGEPPARPPVAATESYAEHRATGDVAGTIVRGLVCGTFERTQVGESEGDEDEAARADLDRTSLAPAEPGVVLAGREGDSVSGDTNPTRERGDAHDRPDAAKSPAEPPSQTSSVAPAQTPSLTLRVSVTRSHAASDVDVTHPESVTSARRTGDATAAGPSSSLSLSGQFGVSESDVPYFHGVARLGLQVAEALTHAHAQGVLHRDIKPSNLILDTAGVIWVTDFGLAKNEGENLTHTGDVVGTLRYMAPERFRGRADARSDIYSLGLTLYEFLTLKPVFPESDRARLVQRVLHEEPPRPRKIDRHVPRDLETIVLKAIDKDPRHRYESAEQFADDLRLYLADKPIQARRTSAAERLWRLCRRNPAVAGLAASVLSLLVFVAVAATLVAINSREHARQLSVENERVLIAEGLANRRLFESYRNEARAERWSRRAGQRFAGLDAIGGAVELLPSLGFEPDENARKQLELRNQAIASMALPDVRRLASWPSDQRRAGWAFDAAVERYALGDMDGNVSVRRLSDNQELIRLPSFGQPAWSIRFSHDGRFIATRHEHYSPATLYVWDLTRWAGFQPANSSGDHRQAESLPHVSGVEVILKVEQVANADALDFSPDNRLIAFGRQDRSISIVNLADGQEQARLPSTVAPRRIRFDPSGKRIAVSTLDDPQTPTRREVQIRHLDTGKIESLEHPAEVRGIGWHPDGNLLATACGNSRVYLWNVATGKRRRVLAGHEQDVIGVSFDPTGNLLASSTWGYTRLWDVSTGHELLTAEGQCGSFSTDGSRLGFMIGWEPGVWEVAAGREWRRLPAESQVRAIHASPDGSLLAAATDDGVQLWHAVTGRTVGSLATGNTMAALFHPNGNELITCGTSGVIRWPLESSPLVPPADGAEDSTSVVSRLQAPPHIRIGPPQKLDELNTNEGRASIDRAGRKLAIDTGTDHADVIDLADPRSRMRLRGHSHSHYIAISPDGKWVATGTWQGNGVKVWDAQTGEVAHDLLPGSSSATVEFSPDGKWLVTGTAQEFGFIEVGSWRVHHRIARDRAGNAPGHIAFTRDGRMAAISQSRTLVSLIDPHTGRQLATLEPPNPDALGWLCFTPGGTHLAADAGNTIHLWNLRRIREQLASMGLDWDQPWYPAAD